MRFLIPAIALALAVSVSASASRTTVRWFYSPSKNIGCEVAAADQRGTYAFCQTVKPPRSVRLKANGRSHVCRGAGCIGDGPEGAFTLRYGHSVRVGPFRCSSSKAGMRCVVIRTGRGFFISREKLSLF